MRMCYLFGDEKYASLEEGATHINVPNHNSATIVMRLLYSGKIVVNVGKGASLILSVIDETVESRQTLGIEVALASGASYAQTINIKECDSLDLLSHWKLGNGAHSTDNIIIAGGKEIGINEGITAGAKSKATVNILAIPEHTATISVSTVAGHAGSNSYSSINCAGCLKNASSVNVISRINVPEGLKGIDSHMQGKFIAFPGAVVSALPVLSIHSKDVKTGHGVSVTNVNEQEIEYLESRGLSREGAMGLVESGLVSSMLEHMGKSIQEISDNMQKRSEGDKNAREYESIQEIK